MANEAVNCPVHGTHGNLSQGKCWFCVKSGLSTEPHRPQRVVSKTQSVVATNRIVGAKRKIG